MNVCKYNIPNINITGLASTPVYAQLLARAGLFDSKNNPLPPVVDTGEDASVTASVIDKIAPLPAPREKWFLLPLLIIDFETFFTRKYRLGVKGMSYEKYFFDPRFKCHCISIRYPDGRKECRTDVDAAIKELQTKYGANLERVVVAAHNTKFDVGILKWKYDIQPPNIFDTMDAAKLLYGVDESASLRALGEKEGLKKGRLDFMEGIREPTPEQLAKLAEYGIRDIEITFALAEKMLLQLRGLPQELWMMEFNTKSWLTSCMSIDLQEVQAGLNELSEYVNTQFETDGYSGKEISGDKSFLGIIGRELAKTGRSIPTKLNKEGEAIPALAKNDPQMRALSKDDDPKIRKLVLLRLLSGTVAQLRSRLNYLSDMHSVTGGFYHPFLKYLHAVTGRFSGGNGHNPQNIPKIQKSSGITKKIAFRIRSALKALPGHTFVAADASQIEARIVAYLAGQLDLLREFARKIDVYSAFGTRVFNTPVMKTEGKTAEEQRQNILRDVAKTAVLGLGFSMGVEKFMGGLKSNPDTAALFSDGTLSEKVCARIVTEYRRKYSRIKSFWRDCEDAFVKAARGQSISLRGKLYFYSNGDTVYIRLPSGRSLVYTQVKVRRMKKKKKYIDGSGLYREREFEGYDITWGKKRIGIYGGKIVENVVQAVARDVLVDTMRRIFKKGWPILLHVHDDIICQVPEDKAAECCEVLISEWRRGPEWIKGLPLDADGKKGVNFGKI